MAILIKVDGSKQNVSPKGGKFTNQEIQSILGCTYFECLSLLNGATIFFDEEGKTKNKLDNFTASELLMEAGGIYGDYIAGDAMVIPPWEVD